MLWRILVRTQRQSSVEARSNPVWHCTPASSATAQRLGLNRRIIQRGKPYRFQRRTADAYLTSNWPRRGSLWLLTNLLTYLRR